MIREEKGSDYALKLRDMYISGEIKIAAPELLLYEVLNTVQHKGLFSENEIKDIAEALEEYSFNLYPLRGEYAAKTVKTAHKNRVTIYDAAYIALAIMKNTHLYTADIKLIEKLQSKYSRYVKSLESLSR